MRPMSPVVVTTSKFLACFLAVFGLYLVGSEGGGLAHCAGALLALLPVLLLVSWGEGRFYSWFRDGVFGLMTFVGLLSMFFLVCREVLGGDAAGFRSTENARSLRGMSVASTLAFLGGFARILVHMYDSIAWNSRGAGGERGHDRFDREPR